MLRAGQRRKGQSILSEVAIIIIVVITAVAAMSTYLRRAYQARIYDADHLMLSHVANVFEKNVFSEYEPYYEKSATRTDFRGEQTWAYATGALVKGYKDFIQRNMRSEQAPPFKANGWK